MAVITICSSGMKVQLTYQCLLGNIGAMYSEASLNGIYMDHIFGKGML